MGGCCPLVVLVCFLAIPQAASLAINSTVDHDHTLHMDILMRGAKPRQHDAYLCTSYEVNEDEAYVVRFEALANADTAHHILMYGCVDGPASDKTIWGCPPICRGGPQQIMFAWAKNAPATQLPEGVGFRIGRKTSIRTIVLQVHYAKSFLHEEEADKSGIRLHMTREKQPYVAGIYLLMSVSFAVPPQTPKFHVDMSCKFRQHKSIFPFAYRTHAHGLGRVITGYQFNETGYHMIGKGNPQWPQAFYPVNTTIEVKPGESLVARCTYNSSGTSQLVRVGATGNDEMCNFYIMFYTDSSVKNPSGECMGIEYPRLVANMPADSDVPLPPNPLLDEMAHGHHHHHHSAMTHTEYTPAEAPTAISATSNKLAPKLQFQQEWPSQHVEIGQVGGVATDNEGNVYIFHRGERVWNQWSFDYDNNFRFKEEPIKEDTIVIYSREGKLVRKFGSGMFFMPHGIEVDDKGNIWLTDVALHQVFRIPRGSTKPDLTLGERFVHFDDDAHFCKPADVAVLASGEFFVADGYCHSRVLKFSKEGNLLKHWGKALSYQVPAGSEPDPGVFAIPHGVTVSEELQMVCVADRENGRIQCFDLEGNFLYSIKYPQFGSRLFSVEYCPQHGGLLFAVNGPTYQGDTDITVQGFTISISHDSHRLLGTWNHPGQNGLQNPHDVAVDVKGHAVYVGELNPAAVWKFQGQVNTSSTITTTTLQSTSLTTSTVTVKSVPGKKSNITPSVGTQSSEDQVLMDDYEEISMSKNGVPIEGEETADFTPSIIIGVLLVIPVVLLLVITLVMRVHHKGWNTCFSNMRAPKVFTMQNFLGNSHKGFDKVSQDDSDHDADVLSDSDNEEFRQPMKSKA